MKMTLRSLAVLLCYPSHELKIHVGEIRDALRHEAALSRQTLQRLEVLLGQIERERLLDLQAAYCDLFDRSRKFSLHLFEHVHGDSRERGPAMIDLGQEYIDHGFLMTTEELPDFIPVFLEFLSCQPPAGVRDWLSQPAHVFAALEERLRDSGSPYAAIFHALLELPHARPDREAVEALHDAMRDEDEKTIDELWEEAPVSFAPPVPQGTAAAVVARIKAAQESVITILKS